MAVKKRKLGFVLRWEIEDPNGNMDSVETVEVNEHRFVREQRYEELSQVASDMYRYMDGVLNKNWAYSLPSDTDAYSDALEALGVRIDD